MSWLGLTMGFVGSLHCLGMCGPIAMALPYRTTSPQVKLYKNATFTIGRILSYAGLGAIFGFLGAGFDVLSLQKTMSATAGLMILLFLTYPILFKKAQLVIDGSSPIQAIKKVFQKQFKSSTLPSFFILGLLNGLLPCGMVYLAVAGAVVTANIYEGSLFMASFGLGTWPVLLGITLFSSFVGRFRFDLTKLNNAFLAVTSIILIYRGIGLEVPLLADLLNLPFGTTTTCN